MATTTHPVHPDVLTLAQLYAAEWPAARLRIRASGHPTCEDPADPPADPVDPPADPVDPPADPPKDPPKDPPADPIRPDDDWQAKARKHERDAKKLRQENEALKAAQAELDAAKMTEQEKAIKAAREEAASEVTTKYEQERRAERLELAVTRIAVGSGIKVGEGDKAKTVKFADAEDVQMWVERRIASGDLDAADMYDENGKVNTSALTEALAGLATSKPSWLAGTVANGSTPPPDFDGGKGKGGGGKSLEDMSPDDHLKEIQHR